MPGLALIDSHGLCYFNCVWQVNKVAIQQLEDKHIILNAGIVFR